MGEVRIPSESVLLPGELLIPQRALGFVVFAHGSGSSRLSPRNRFVASVIREAGIGTLIFDLLTLEEEALDARSGHLRFDIAFLARRLRDATRWVLDQESVGSMNVGYFGSSTGGAAALAVAAEEGERIGAIVSRGGRPDLAGPALLRVRAPTLLIVGGFDEAVIRMNQEAFEQMQCVKELKIVPGATHLFHEPGTLERVARLAAEWFRVHLVAT